MMLTRTKEWPHGMTATATHDTKRGEDARARLAALTEIPDEWTSTVAQWKLLNAPHVVLNGNKRAPTASREYMLYQTLLGAWPLQGADESFTERIQAYALKAVREAKQETSWLNPQAPYEDGLKTFVARILDDSISGEFLDSLSALARRVALLGALNSLSQLTLKATLPGVPDFYQGTEFWDLSLVDPDNRRPVDFTTRVDALAAMHTPDWEKLAQTWSDGCLKLAWTAHLLKIRNGLAEVFADGDYQPLEVNGPHRDHIVAFARRRGRNAAIVVVARWFAPSTQGGRNWPKADAFDASINVQGFAIEGDADSGAALRASSLFQPLPVAVLRASVVSAARPARRKAMA
jgi:(1->4)-alpha-D-glucan 1-alpha-D-glucosylmutase